jgi:selenium metabolism protein YedF
MAMGNTPCQPAIVRSAFPDSLAYDRDQVIHSTFTTAILIRKNGICLSIPQGANMTETIDARGLACPEPAIRTGKALRDHDEIVVIVDNSASVQNIRGAVIKRGFDVHVDQQGDDFHLTIIRKEGANAEGMEREMYCLPQGETVVFLPADTIGRGNDELGGILAKGIIYSLTQVDPKPDTLILMNSGVKLAVAGSDLLDDLVSLTAGGMRLLVCGTCLDYFGIKDDLKVGEVSNAYTIMETMLEAGKVIRL